MNGFTEKDLAGASEGHGVIERLLTGGESRAMLPLVGRVAKDIMRHRDQLVKLRPERDRLERRRHNLDWPQRQRRYLIQEEILTVEKELSAVAAELDALGLALL